MEIYFLVLYVEKNSFVLINLKTGEMECVDNIVDKIMLMYEFNYNNYSEIIKYISKLSFEYSLRNNSIIAKRIANAKIYCF